jgi:hypothetical protein
MTATPQPGQTWIDQRPMTDRREWRDKTRYRRLVAVTASDPDGFVEGFSSWQVRARTGWTAMDYPPARTTRISADVFVRRFVRSEES